MIYVTGDTHGDFSRLFSDEFSGLTKKDYMIICGDFGGVWRHGSRQEGMLDCLTLLPFNILFVDGNHENFNLLNEYMGMFWKGGHVRYIRSNVKYLIRGEIYDIDNHSIFVMGGAASHDIHNGVLDKDAPGYWEESRRLQREGKFFRVKNESWWEQELPDEKEIDRGWQNLCDHEKKVDYIITHCAPTGIQKKISRKLHNNTYKPDRLTDFLERVYKECEFKEWYCGHYHKNMRIKRVNVLYEDIVRLYEGNLCY